MKITDSIVQKYQQEFASIDSSLFSLLNIDKNSIIIMNYSRNLFGLKAEILTNSSYIKTRVKKDFSKIMKKTIVIFDSIINIALNPEKFNVTFIDGKNDSFEIQCGGIVPEQSDLLVLKKIINNSKNLTSVFFRENIKKILSQIEPELDEEIPIVRTKEWDIVFESVEKTPEEENALLKIFEKFLMFLALYGLKEDNRKEGFFEKNLKKADIYYAKLLIRFLSFIPEIIIRVSSETVHMRQEEMRGENLVSTLYDIVLLHEAILNSIVSDVKLNNKYKKWDLDIIKSFPPFVRSSWKKIFSNNELLLNVFQESYNLGLGELKEVLDKKNS